MPLLQAPHGNDDGQNAGHGHHTGDSLVCYQHLVVCRLKHSLEIVGCQDRRLGCEHEETLSFLELDQDCLEYQVVLLEVMINLGTSHVDGFFLARTPKPSDKRHNHWNQPECAEKEKDIEHDANLH